MVDRTFLILGGAGLVGFQVAARIAETLHPERLVLVTRRASSVASAAARLRALAPGLHVVEEWGDVFMREEFSRRGREELLSDPACREGIFEDLLGPVDGAYDRSLLAALLARYRPDVVVDSVNTATAISYQDVYAASVIAKHSVESLEDGDRGDVERDVEALILSQSEPQLVRHVLILDRALRAAGTRLYLKVGTTGTGGMGLNIPFTHSEDRPSAKLMTKAAVAFAHTGLLFLMARSAGGPIVKEIKPAALVGYGAIAYAPVLQSGRPVKRYRAADVPLGDRLQLRLDPDDFAVLGDVRLPVVDTGENGLFTRGEYEAITAVGQMEFVTPEEIAAVCVDEIRGAGTGREVIGAVDGAVMGPSYRAGVLRAEALQALVGLETETGTHSVALGQLGPPELSKLLWEAELLRIEFETLAAVVAVDAETVSRRIAERLGGLPDLRDTATSLGLGILSADGEHLTRGPHLRIPELTGVSGVDVTPGDVDRWASKGWVDLRPANWARWQERFAAMHTQGAPHPEAGSGTADVGTYPFDDIRIGLTAAWVLANEHGGYRVR